MVSEWHGWLAAIAKENEETDSIVEHLPPINAPITSPITVQEVIRIFQAVSTVMRSTKNLLLLHVI